MVDLKQNIQYIKGVGPNRAKLLENLNIYTLEDLITYYPREYEDRGKPKKIMELQDGEEALSVFEENQSKITDEPYHSLMNPMENNNSQIVVSLEEAPFKSVVSEIAAQAVIDIAFKGKLPETFSINLQSEDPFNALCSIAIKTGVNFYRDGKTWFMEGDV